MQRSHLLRWVGLAIGLLGTQCLDSISDDCTKTLTCEDAEQPRLLPNCVWEYPDGRPWPGGPQFDREAGLWRWPDGKPTATQTFQCNIEAAADAGGDGGPTGPDCRVEATPCDFPRVCDTVTGNCFECLGDAECAGNMPMGDAGAFTVCDLTIHRCVECTENRNCSGDTRLCKVDSTNTRRNACVECLENGDCSELPATPACDDTTNECTATCQSTADCANGDKKACNVSRGLCVECTETSHCTAEGKGLCDTASNQCVQCLDDGPCAANGGVCDLESHTCVECREDAQCQSRPEAAVLPYCDVEEKRCVACMNDLQCTAGNASRCNLVLHQCAGCTNSTQCEEGQHCKLGEPAGLCVECLEESDCTNPDEPHCETTSGRCVECFDSSQCTSREEAHCETSPDVPLAARYNCVACVGNDDCTADGKGLPPLCDPGRGGGICSECTVAEGAADCSDRGPGFSRCQNGSCVPCSVDADCALHAGPPSNTPACQPNVGCVQCTDNSDCTDTAATPVCKTQEASGAAVNTCVQCTTNADCQDNASASLCVDNECVPCRQDTDCADVDSNGALPGGLPLDVCDGGTCVQCTGPKNAACSNGTNVCNSLLKTCTERPARGAGLCEECVSDLECAASARCISQAFSGTPIGNFCVPTPIAGNCDSLRPYFGSTSVATLDSVTPTAVCVLRETTCPGLNAQTNACDANADCGAPGVNDGVCVAIGGGSQCTTPCTSDNDCNGDCELTTCAL